MFPTRRNDTIRGVSSFQTKTEKNHRNIITPPYFFSIFFLYIVFIVLFLLNRMYCNGVIIYGRP